MLRPYIVIPMGDPAGIGPEIVLKALGNRKIHECARCCVVGDAPILKAAMEFPNTPHMKIKKIASPAEGSYEPGILNVIDLAMIHMDTFELGKVSGECGQAAYAYIEKSTDLCLKGEADAMATTPINKESLRAGGINFIGHTEILAALTNTEDPLTMFEVYGMRVFFLSRHMSLRKACDMVVKERIVDYGHRCIAALRQLGVSEGTMAIAGLNPHSGEHGLFGDEEVNEIIPAVEQLQAEGYQVCGPIGADSVFHQALQGKFNSVLSLYHDQGHIATKTLDFAKTISITNGLPFLRTSVDHGTALDIAGKGIADSVSMEEAIRLAVKYAPAFSVGGKKEPLTEAV
ncbi:MAG: 4-hydroxythreonine-4-phosphate dehydrogenase PdxA [Lachnospiraceae bacterium]|nr:4-hydroxythreonine-4-phosphate dehydrogenase PdxA [Lachnospiraceae bacterium]